MDIVTQAGIGRQLHDFIYNTFPRARMQNLNPESRLLEDGLVDSLGLLEIIGFLEETYNITVDDSDVVASNFNSIDTLTRYIESKLL